MSKESKSYEKMLGEVEGIITKISGDKTGLDEIVENVEKAYVLIGQMKERLDSSKEKVDQLREQYEEKS